MSPMKDSGRPHLWTLAVIAMSLPFLILLCLTLWRTPYPIDDSIGHFEDVTGQSPSAFLVPQSSYYRPLFYITLATMWNQASSIADALTAIRFLHIVPITVLLLVFICHVRPRTLLDAAAASMAVAVLVGSPGFRDNLELPLSYTIVGMAAALMVWVLLERDRRPWHGAAIVGLALIAMGFKEQGLVIVPVVITAWWVGAPGAGRGTVGTLAVMAAVYVAFRLTLHDARLPMFEQDVGFAFDRLSPADAEARFGAFPLGVFVYSGASTIANVLFAEPTGGVFRTLSALTEGTWQPWHVVHLLSSALMTGLIVWWGCGAMRRTADGRWSPDARLFIVTLVVLAATGALSFNYSRDRLGGMAVPFYALAAFAAVRAAVMRAAHASRVTTAAAVMSLLVLGASWQFRAAYTLELTRQRAVSTEREWATRFRQRHTDSAGRSVYRGILDDMLQQGTDPEAIRLTQYPRWITRMLGEY